MNPIAKVASLSGLSLAAVGLTQAHYVISHFATIAEIGAVVTVGAAIWTGKSIMGKRKGEPNPTEVTDQPGISEQAQAYLLGLRQQALPKPTQVIDYTNASQEVTRSAKRTV